MEIMLMKRSLRALLFILFSFSFSPIAAQDSVAVVNTKLLKFAYLSYEQALKAMPDYQLVQKSLSELRAQYEAEQQRVEQDFNIKYEEFLEGQRDFPESILRKRQTELKELLERITHGYVDDEYLKVLAGRLSRINTKSNDEQRGEFERLAGIGMKDLATRIYDALGSGQLPPFEDVNEPNNERRGLVAPLANHPDARKYLLILNAGFVDILQPGEDELISKGFSIEEATATTAAFEQYVTAHKDEIEALRIIYNNQGEPLTYSMLKELDTQLRFVNAKFNPALLWNTYAIVRPADVVKFTTKDEKEALTNIIQLVRFAFKHIPKLESLKGEAAKYFNLWCGQGWRGISEKQNELLGQVVNYIVSNGACTIEDIKEEDKTQAGQLVMAFGGIQAANVALASLSQFMIYRKTA